MHTSLLAPTTYLPTNLPNPEVWFPVYCDTLLLFLLFCLLSWVNFKSFAGVWPLLTRRRCNDEMNEVKWSFTEKVRQRGDEGTSEKVRRRDKNERDRDVEIWREKRKRKLWSIHRLRGNRPENLPYSIPFHFDLQLCIISIHNSTTVTDYRAYLLLLYNLWS